MRTNDLRLPTGRYRLPGTLGMTAYFLSAGQTTRCLQEADARIVDARSGGLLALVDLNLDQGTYFRMPADQAAGVMQFPRRNLAGR